MDKCDIETAENAEEALTGTHADEWNKSIIIEYDSLIKNGTCELANLPEGQVAIGCKWVYDVKKNKEGGIQN